MNLKIADNSELRIDMRPGLRIYFPEIISRDGATNERLKLISQKYFNDRLVFVAEGITGKSHLLGITNPDRVYSIDGADIKWNNLQISFPGSESSTFLMKEIKIRLK